MDAIAFQQKWIGASDEKEHTASQPHFYDPCDLLDGPKPLEHRASRSDYTFEKGVGKAEHGDGWAVTSPRSLPCGEEFGPLNARARERLRRDAGAVSQAVVVMDASRLLVTGDGRNGTFLLLDGNDAAHRIAMTVRMHPSDQNAINAVLLAPGRIRDSVILMCPAFRIVRCTLVIRQRIQIRACLRGWLIRMHAIGLGHGAILR